MFYYFRDEDDFARTTFLTEVKQHLKNRIDMIPYQMTNFHSENEFYLATRSPALSAEDIVEEDSLSPIMNDDLIEFYYKHCKTFKYVDSPNPPAHVIRPSQPPSPLDERKSSVDIVFDVDDRDHPLKSDKQVHRHDEPQTSNNLNPPKFISFLPLLQSSLFVAGMI